MDKKTFKMDYEVIQFSKSLDNWFVCVAMKGCVFYRVEFACINALRMRVCA